MSIPDVATPSVIRQPDLIWRSLFAAVDTQELDQWFDNIDDGVDNFYKNIKEQEQYLKNGEETAFTNPVNRAFAWMELIEHVLKNNFDAAKSLFEEAQTKGIFDVERLAFELPGGAEKVNMFLKRVELSFEKENEAHFSPMIEEEEDREELRRVKEDASEKRTSPLSLEKEIEVRRYLEQRKLGGKQGWQRV